MLKGLKLKTKLPENSSSQPPQAQESKPVEIEPQPEWMKGAKETAIEPQKMVEEISEDDLLVKCQEIWSAFQNSNTDAVKQRLKELRRKEQQLFTKMLREQTPVQPPKLVSEEDELFDEIEKNVLKNFDQRKSAYLVGDLMKEEVKLKRGTDDRAVFDTYKRKAINYNYDNLYDMEYDKDFSREKAPDEKVDPKDEARKSKRDEKLEEKRKQKDMIDQRKLNRTLANCKFCLSNNAIQEEQILSNGKATLLILPDIKRYSYGHFYIVPVEHVGSITEMDENEYEEVRNFMKCLVAMHDKLNHGVVFIENCYNIAKTPHCVIECIATPREISSDLPMYFKKALSELESEWATHKKIIEIRKEKGGIRKQIPKGFPYIYVDFDTAYGYAHVIEKLEKYNKDFAHEIIGSLLGIEKGKINNPEKYERSELAKIKTQFQNKWFEHDWTKLL